MIRSAFHCMLFFWFAGICAEQNKIPASVALEKLQALAGDWEGTVEWTGAITRKGTMKASYYSAGHASTVIENVNDSGEPGMISVYHLDGADLRMTHFCLRNQPRFKASRIDMAEGIMDFAFVDITNLSSADAPHVVGVERRFPSADHIVLTFVVDAGGKMSRERIDLKRVRSHQSGGSTR